MSEKEIVSWYPARRFVLHGVPRVKSLKVWAFRMEVPASIDN
jgi:hypothetical protein